MPSGSRGAKEMHDYLGRYGASQPKGLSTSEKALEKKLNTLFDALKDDPVKSSDSDKIMFDGCEEYCSKLGVDMADIPVFVLLELVNKNVQKPNMGEITRQGFLDGWRDTNCETLAKQEAWFKKRMQSFPSDKAAFERVYKHTFELARGDKGTAVDLAEAITYWSILFGSKLSPTKWNSSETPWLDWWTEFLESRKGFKGVNKDLWYQTLKFAEECLKDDSLNWWSEEAAWPGIIDEFVEWVRERRPKPEEDEDDMDIE